METPAPSVRGSRAFAGGAATSAGVMGRGSTGPVEVEPEAEAEAEAGVAAEPKLEAVTDAEGMVTGGMAPAICDSTDESIVITVSL